ncbi:MAG: sporulation protein, partial [Ruminococcus sp.]|nr:sporulation protein [Ruminococcus sp.]
MSNENSFKKTLAVIAGTVLTFSAVPVTAIAEDTTTSSTAETTVGTDTSTVTEISTETTTATETVDIPAEEEEEKEIEWFKAELDEYDDSLSLISYESSPEASGNSKKKSKEPTPVELNVTGGYVGDIPWLESEPVIESIPGKFAIVTYGWGHGVGMSQNGANFYAMYSGWTYQDILYHYYPDTYLMNTGLAEEEEITVNGVSGDVLSMVSQIVYNEVGGTMSYEAIKAQAVAVYSYCKYNGNDAADLRCKPCPPQVVVDAVSEVLGQALYY